MIDIDLTGKTVGEFNELLNNDAALAFAFLNGLAWIKRYGNEKIFLRIIEGDDYGKTC